MSRQIDYRSTSPYPADEVYATMVDPEFLRARLDRIGGPGAALLEHRVDAEGARYRLRHGIDGKDLPPVVAKLVPGDIVIERTETLRREGAGRYSGGVDVRIPGAPARAVGQLRLTDTDQGSELLVHADVTVQVPLLGGTIEAVIGKQVQNLLAAETAFTQHWLATPR